jgi:hypothetical protein
MAEWEKLGGHERKLAECRSEEDFLQMGDEWSRFEEKGLQTGYEWLEVGKEWIYV